MPSRWCGWRPLISVRPGGPEPGCGAAPERVAVILDIEVTVAAHGDVRAAYASLDGKTAGVRYAGTVDGLAG